MEAVLNSVLVWTRTRLAAAAAAALRRIARRGPPSAAPTGTIAGRALILVIAIMTYLACLTIGAVSMMTRTAESWRAATASEITIQVRPVDGVSLDAEAQKAAEAARAVPGIVRASVINAEDGAALLRPWLGDGLDLSTLPVPRLVVLETDRDKPPVVETLRRRLSSVRGASVDDHRMWRSRLAAMARTMIALGAFVLALVLAATGLIVIFATRGAMAGSREAVEVMSLIGARRSFVAREFQRRFLAVGLKGAAAGGAAALATFLIGRIAFSLIGTGHGADQVAALFGAFSLGPAGWFGAVAAVFCVAGLTAATSRMVVLHALKDA